MTRVADRAGLERTHLYRKLKQLGIELVAWFKTQRSCADDVPTAHEMPSCAQRASGLLPTQPRVRRLDNGACSPRGFMKIIIVGAGGSALRSPKRWFRKQTTSR